MILSASECLSFECIYTLIQSSPSILCRDLSDVWFVVLEWELTYSEITFFNCLLRVVTDTNFKANGQKLMKLEQFEFFWIPLRFSAGIAFALPFEGDGLSELPFDSLQTLSKNQIDLTSPILIRSPWNFCGFILPHTPMSVSIFRSNGQF